MKGKGGNTLYLVKLVKPKKLFSKEQSFTRVFSDLDDAVNCARGREKGFNASVYLERIYNDVTDTKLLWSSEDNDEEELPSF